MALSNSEFKKVRTDIRQFSSNVVVLSVGIVAVHPSLENGLTRFSMFVVILKPYI